MRSKAIEEHKKKLRLNSVQREVIVGKLLGDATLETQNGGRTYRLRIEQGKKQKFYVDHLYDIFREWVLTPPQRKITLIDGKSYSKWTFSTVSHGAFRFYAHQFYKEGRKCVPKLIHRLLTERSLAYWFMDDGSIKSAQSKGVVLNTQSFTQVDVQRLIFCLEHKFKLSAKERRQKEGYQIYISGRSYERLSRMISPYLLPTMRYKLPEPRRTYLPKR